MRTDLSPLIGNVPDIIDKDYTLTAELIKTVPHTIPLLMAIDETFDVGADSRTRVDDSYDIPFRFTGTIDKLTFDLGPSQLTAETAKRLPKCWPMPMTK